MMEMPYMADAPYFMGVFMGIIGIVILCSGIFFLISALVMPLINRSRINKLRIKHVQLATNIKDMRFLFEKNENDVLINLKNEQASSESQPHPEKNSAAEDNTKPNTETLFGVQTQVLGGSILLLFAGFILLGKVMEAFIGLTGWLCCLILPWINRSSIKKLHTETEQLTTVTKKLEVILKWKEHPEMKDAILKTCATAPDTIADNIEHPFHTQLMILCVVIFLISVALFQLHISIVTIICGGLGIFCLINRHIINKLQNESDQFRSIVQELTTIFEIEGSYPPKTLKSEKALHHAPPQDAPEVISQNKVTDNEEPEFTFEKEEPASRSSEATPASKKHIGFEQQFGVRLPVWIGGIALTLAGVFLVKYSIDINLLTPAVRVVLGGLLGGTLLYSAEWVRKKTHFENGVRIAQSLSGAGIAVLYASLFAATNLYQLISYPLGFSGMAIVTATAVALSLMHGPPIALLGLIGGFCTPALLGPTPPHSLTFFVYLYLLFFGLLLVISRKNWWILSFPTLLGAFFWVVFWTTSVFAQSDALWLGLFLIAVSATIVICSKNSYEQESTDKNQTSYFTSILNYIGLSGALILLGIITGKAGFDIFEWSLFGLLAAGGICLAYLNDRLYGFVPLVSVTVTIGMLIAWDTAEVSTYAFILTAFALAFAGSGYFCLWRTKIPLLWAGLTGATSIAFYLLAYFKLRHTELVDSIPSFWSVTAITLAGIAVYTVHKIRVYYRDHPKQDHLLALFAATSAAFISIALTIELQRDFLPVAFTAEMFSIAWIYSRIPIKALRPICMALALAFVILLLPQLHLLGTLLMISKIGGVKQSIVEGVSLPIIQWPVFQLGVPAAMFIGASYFLRRDHDDIWVQSLELAAIILTAVMGYYLTRHAFYVELNDILFAKADFLQRGIFTNILFIIGFVWLFFGNYFDRFALTLGGVGLCAIGIFRIIFFDFLFYNPLWTHQKIEGWLVCNNLLLPYGLPILWTLIAESILPLKNRKLWSNATRGFALLLLFVLINMNVRYFFHGEYLGVGITTNTEIYTYSVAWLILAITLLLAGVISKAKLLRYTSLVVMILTVGKVFLYDASELTGLYRVFSFLGLGLCLLGLSWFYTRFIFKDNPLPPSN
ncbi:DUF2339 domain-containing protein [Halodesulfovibrio aestuarii]|uniref:DUF2339 domain-containing protein n=1 Tax=Halodesulfovibrio aestuarii TaxID=126333 RepID=UPI000409E4A5